MENIDYLIDYLLNENKKIVINKKATNFLEKFKIYRSLSNIRLANPISNEYIEHENKLLKEITQQKNITNSIDINNISSKYPENNLENDDIITLWQGDITTLEVECIVNAANSRGLGCFSPCHNCIDNQINTYAGVQLRLECNEIMKKYNYNLPTGEAFITKAYNLPSDYIIHTVGPIIDNVVSDEKQQQLSNCYINSLKIAKENNIRSIAFPCISTGVFMFPSNLAAKIALTTVDDFLSKNRDSFDKIIFNLYSNKDVMIYERFI